MPTDNIRQIIVGPEFFAKAPLDYASPDFALIREFVQNCVDAPGSDRIEITLDEAARTLSVENNGAPMSEDVLVNVFLSLGGTTKSAGDVGGFGKAKELCCYTHQSYEIHTGDLLVNGAGASYSLRAAQYRRGTKTTIKYDPGVFYNLYNSIHQVTGSMLWVGTMIVNGEEVKTNLDARTRRNLEGIGKVKVLTGGRGNLIIRAGGVPMFISRCAKDDSTVILDLIGDTKSLLTSNRDGLRYGPRQVLEAFVRTISSDSRVLKSMGVDITDYGHALLEVEIERKEEAMKEIEEFAKHRGSTPEDHYGINRDAAFAPVTQSPMSFKNEVTQQPAVDEFDHRFTVRNETGMKLDRAYLPQTFSAASRRLVRDWVVAISRVHRALNVGGKFSVGFIFSEDALALHEVRSGICTYYINPAPVARVTTGKNAFRTLRRTKLDRHDLLSYALHEVLHGAYNLQFHDEAFCSAFTVGMAKVLRYKP